VYVRRYYAQEDVLDCEKTPVAGPTVALEQGGRRLPAVLGFPDGRILVGWESNFQHPNGGKSLTRVRLRYLK
jgi:hypothetical protein